MEFAGLEPLTLRYEVLEQVAATGGQGVVFKAVVHVGSDGADPAGAGDLSCPQGTVVALKRILPGAIGFDRVEPLHRAIARRRHPSLGEQVEVFRTASRITGLPDEVADALYVSMVWVDGETVADRAEGAGLRELLRWARQVAEALDYFHADLYGDGPLLHRDIKPTNIIVTPDGRAVLIDPGLARVGPSSVTGSPYGTPGFIPPECDADPTAGSPAADRWQLAATLVNAILGSPPGWIGDREELRSALRERCRHEVAHPEALVDALLSMLDPDPLARPESAAAWVASLHMAAVAPGEPRSLLGRRPVRIAGAAIVIAVLAIGGVIVRSVVSDTMAAGAGSVGRRALVDTHMTSGMTVDDPMRSYLSTKPIHMCRARGCDVPDSTVSTGMEVTLTCRTFGERVTNGNDLTPVDDKNPILFESSMWFGVHLDDGTSGLLSEVWIHPDHRGSKGLPFC